MNETNSSIIESVVEDLSLAGHDVHQKGNRTQIILPLLKNGKNPNSNLLFSEH